MYSGVNDENNQGAFNDENSLYHYSYSKDREPQPGQPDPSQTSWQPASRPEDPVSPEEPVAYPAGAPDGAGGSDLLHHRRLSG